MFTLLRPFIASSLCLCIAAHSVADTIEEVEVLGERQAAATVIDVNLETYNGFEQIINRSEFENRLVDVGDIVNSSVSAQIRKSGGMGSYSAASIRGTSGKQINLFLDGMLLTSPQSGYSNISIIPTSIIEQVEIYPDFTPAELGDANLGGAINIRTRIPETGFGGRVAAAYGSFNSRRLSLDLWGGNNKTDAIVAFDYTGSDNDFPMDDKHCNKGLVTCGKSKKRLNAAYEQYSALSKVRHQFNNQYALQVLLGSSIGENETPVPNNRSSHYALLKNQLHQLNIMLESDDDWLRWGARIYGNLQNSDYSQHTVGRELTTHSTTQQKQTSLGTNIFAALDIANNVLSTTLDYSLTKANTHDNQPGYRIDVNAERKKLAFILADTWQITKLFSINANYRINHYKDTTEAPSNKAGNAYCDGDDKACKQFEKTLDSWQAGIAITPNNWTIKANIGEMNRMPTLTERFGQTGTFRGNATLKHEQSFNSEFGVIYQNEWLDLSLTAFQKKITNGISVIYDSLTGIGKAFNFDKSTIDGVESLARFQVSSYVSFHIGAQWLDSNTQSEIKAYHDKQLVGTYHQSYQAGLNFTHSAHNFKLAYYLDQDLYFDRANRQPSPDRKLLNTSYSWTVNQLTLNLSVNNILDYRYFDFSFMPSPGRNFTTTLSYSF